MDYIEYRKELTRPGDELRIRITKTNRRVSTYKRGDKSRCYSKVEYSNGTVVETKVIKSERSI